MMEIASMDNEIAGISFEAEKRAYYLPNEKFAATRKMVVVESPIIDRTTGRLIGTISIYLNLSEIKSKTLKNSLFIFLGILFLILMLLLIDRYRLTKLVVERVNDLSEFVLDNIGFEERRKLAISGNDEIARLGGVIDAFAEKAYGRVSMLSDAVDEKNEMLALAQAELKRQTRIDDLTGLCNRMEFDKQIGNEWFRMQRAGRPISLILCDIDEYERLNDRFDPAACDDCLKEVAAIVERSCRRSADLPARFGEKTFAALLPETDSKGARIVAESIRAEVEKAAISREKAAGGDERVTLSFGIGTMIPGAGTEHNYLVALADSALFESKENGGGRITANLADGRNG